MARVIEIERQPPSWSVKVGYQYQATFLGADAKEKALKFAARRYSTIEIVERTDRSP